MGPQNKEKEKTDRREGKTTRTMTKKHAINEILEPDRETTDKTKRGENTNTMSKRHKGRLPRERKLNQDVAPKSTK